jgi:hypothetical protein
MSWNILRLPTQQDSLKRIHRFDAFQQEAEANGNERDAQHWQGMATSERHIHSHLRPPRALSIERLKS